MRYERFTPTWPGFGDAVLVTDKSALVGLTTFNVACTECVVGPDCALIVNEWLLTGVLNPVVTERVDVLEFASVILIAGAKVPTAAVGSPDVLRFTRPVKPASGVTVTV